RALVTRADNRSGETKGEFEPGRKRLIADIRRYLDGHQLPALVVHLPSRSSLLSPDYESALHLEKAKLLAKELAAAFVDGGQIFAGKTPAEVRDLFLPYDGHWNQRGSDLFAEFIIERLGHFRQPRGPTSAVTSSSSPERLRP